MCTLTQRRDRETQVHDLDTHSVRDLDLDLYVDLSLDRDADTLRRVGGRF